MEVRYDKNTGEITGWSQSRKFLKPRSADEIVEDLNIKLPSEVPGLLKVDTGTKTIVSKTTDLK